MKQVATVKQILSLILPVGILFVPFLLREGLFPFMKTEPYPAVLFPVGASQINLDDQTIQAFRLELFAVDEAGEEHPLDPGEFIRPIPAHYWPYLASKSKQFGLAQSEGFALNQRFGSWNLSLDLERISTDKERREVLHWLSERLHAVGRPLDQTLLVRGRTASIDTVTGNEIGSTTSFEYRIALDDPAYLPKY